MTVRVGLFAVVLALGVTWVASAQTRQTVPARAEKNFRAARRDAHELLAKLVLPAGAMAVKQNPSTDAWLSQPQLAQDTPALVDAHRFYRVAGEAPDAVSQWFQSHTPAGSSLDTTASGNGNYSAYGWAFPSVAGVLANRQLVATIAPARGGGTAIRIDAEDIYWVPRPRSERLPADIHLIDVSVQRLNPTSTSYLTVTNPIKVAKVVSLVNALAPAQPGVSSCPADVGPEVTMIFLTNNRKTAPLAKVVADGSGCGGVSLSLTGIQKPALSGGYTLDHQLERILGFKG